MRKKTKKSTFFSSKTFAAKLFLKLTNNAIDPVISCVSILKFEPQNRSNDEIRQTLPWLSSLQDFFTFICLKEEEEGSINLLMEVAWILFYQFSKKYSIIRRAGEKQDFFYLVLNGSVIELQLVFKNECLNEEDYIKHIIKMDILEEREIINKCLTYNKNELNIESCDTIEEFCLNNKFDYKRIYNSAIIELKDLGYDLEKIDLTPSVEKYIKATTVENEIKRKSVENAVKKYFYVPHYEIIGKIDKGRFIGNLSTKCNQKDYRAYISLENSDIGYINKTEYKSSKLFKLIKTKMRKIFKDTYQMYFIFNEIPRDYFIKNYAKLIIFSQYQKGEKIFSQNSLHEGIYLIKDGEFTLSTRRKLEELNVIIASLQNSLGGFDDYISKLKDTKIKNNDKDAFSNPIYQSKEYLAEIRGVKEIILGKVHKGEILGLYDCFNYKTDICHFDAICSSETAIVYFIPKIFIPTLISREPTVKDAIMKLVELKSSYYIGSLNNFRNLIIQNIAFKIGMTEFLDKNNGNKNKPINKLMKGNSSNFDKRNSLLMNQNIPNNYNGNNINSFRRNLVVNTENNINNKNEDKGFGNKSQNYLHFRLSTNYDEIKNLHSSKTLNSNILNNSKLLTNQSSGVKKAATNIAFKNESNIKKNYSFK
jgi:CRP-like cAMP-binding protein